MKEVRVTYWMPVVGEVSEDIPLDWLQDAVDIIIGDDGEVLKIEEL